MQDSKLQKTIRIFGVALLVLGILCFSFLPEAFPNFIHYVGGILMVYGVFMIIGFEKLIK